ncbi:hypothetical protein OGZ01_10085 [Vibrio harveyi]|nr:hypothetical protein [Vibrio harveyi]
MKKHLLTTSLFTAAAAISAVASYSTYAAEIGSLEAVTQFNDYRGAGVTVTPEGRLIVSMHPLDNPKYRVVEVMANGTKRPFPTMDWSDGPEVGDVGLIARLLAFTPTAKVRSGCSIWAAKPHRHNWSRGTRLKIS